MSDYYAATGIKSSTDSHIQAEAEVPPARTERGWDGHVGIVSRRFVAYAVLLYLLTKISMLEGAVMNQKALRAKSPVRGELTTHKYSHPALRKTKNIFKKIAAIPQSRRQESRQRC